MRSSIPRPSRIAGFITVLILVGLAGVGRSLETVESAPQTLNVSGSGTAVLTITFRAEDDIGNVIANDSSIVVDVTVGGTLGSFTSASDLPAEVGGVACTPTGVLTTVLTYGDICVEGVDLDLNEDIQPALAFAAVTIVWTCTGNGQVTFRITQAEGVGGLPTQQLVAAQCTVSGSFAGVSLITVTASPNALICGGQTTLTALLRDIATGAGLPGTFHFETTAGLIVATSNNTATLALLPAQSQATVTASTIGIRPGQTIPEVLTGTVVVLNHCAQQIPTGNSSNSVAIALVASPNVVPCGGTSRITATARDVSGQIIPGVGFTFSTSTGGLISQPNNATATGNAVDLTIQPGMGQSADGVADAGIRFVAVTASVGNVSNTINVQQYCPGVDTDPSVAPGRIVLTPSNNQLSCNETTFIGAIVRDSKGQVPRDVAVDFIATSGGFLRPGGGATSSSSSSSSTPTTSTSIVAPSTATKTATVSTKNGSLNVIYVADSSTTGEVIISAAAGSAFGSTKIRVNCAGALLSGGPGAVSGAGGAIRPPNTGDAGLRD